MPPLPNLKQSARPARSFTVRGDEGVRLIEGVAVLAVRQVPVRVSVAALGVHVPDVVARGAEKQVCWVYALAIIAPMADEQSIGNRPVRELVREAMGVLGPALMAHHPVPRTAQATLPLPAFICAGYADLRPKPIGQWLRFPSIYTHRHERNITGAAA